MLGVLVTVLKIIGIIILVIIGLILLLVLLALFVPIRYRFQGEYYDSFCGDVRVYWLSRIVWMKYSFKEEDSYFILRVFGMKVFSTNVDEEEIIDKTKEQAKDVGKAGEHIAENEAKDHFVRFEKRKNHQKLEKKIEKVEEEIGSLIKEKENLKTEEQIESIKMEKEIEKEYESESEKEKDNEIDNEYENINESQVKKDKNSEIEIEVDNTNKIENGNTDKRQKVNLWHKMKQIGINIKMFFAKIKSYILKTINFFKNLKDRIKIIYANIIDISNREAVKILYQTTKQLLKHIWPRRGRLQLKYGMEDPATTGYILGAASIVTAGFGKKVQIEPVFNTDQTFFEGKGWFKGRIYLVILLKHLIKLYRNKKIKLIIIRFNKRRS